MALEAILSRLVVQAANEQLAELLRLTLSLQRPHTVRTLTGTHRLAHSLDWLHHFSSTARIPLPMTFGTAMSRTYMIPTILFIAQTTIDSPLLDNLQHALNTANVAGLEKKLGSNTLKT